MPDILTKINIISTGINFISQLGDGYLLVLSRSPFVADNFFVLFQTTFSQPCLQNVLEFEIINEMKNQPSAIDIAWNKRKVDQCFAILCSIGEAHTKIYVSIT